MEFEAKEIASAGALAILVCALRNRRSLGSGGQTRASCARDDKDF
jgi:hypothetical protein